MKESRFEYTKFDEESIDMQNNCKIVCQELEKLIGYIGIGTGVVSPKSARAKALALTKLEETYMWIGKAIRDDQTERESLSS